MMTTQIERAAHRSARSFRVLGAVALVFGTLGYAGCSNPLEVNDPDIVEPESVDNPAGLESRRLGAFGDFAEAYSGDNGGEEGFVLLTGLLADEFVHSGTFTERTMYDARRITDTGVLVSFYSNLHRARRAAESTAADIAAGADPVALAQMNNLAGYSYIMFGEMFCSGVPYSTVSPSGDLEFGQPQTTAQTFARAIDRFDQAAAAAGAAGDAELQSLAAVGKARALLNLNQPAEAAAAVAGVPTDFLYQIQHSINSGRQENGIFVFVSLSERWSVANLEGTNGLAFRDLFASVVADALVPTGDPRTPWTFTPGDVGFDQGTPQFDQLKYPGRAEPSTLASGAEARLIEAEALLRTGGDWLGVLNTLRAGAGLAPLADPGSQAADVDLFFAERAYWLWLTGHRLGDMRRLVRQYGRAPNTVYTVGPYHKTPFATYGTDLVFPIPLQERNNPTAPQSGPVFATCLNTNA